MHDDVTFLFPPPQLTEHSEIADQGDQEGQGEVLHSITLFELLNYYFLCNK